MDNAAARLCAILEACKKVDPKTNCALAWRTVLGAKNNIELLGLLGEFLKLTEDAAREVLHHHPDEQPAVDHWRSAIFNAYHSSPLNGTWEPFARNIEDTVIFSLRSQSKIVFFERPRKSIEADTLEAIKSVFKEALNSLQESNLEVEIKIALYARISNIIHLIERYKFSGQDAILDSAKVLAAEIDLVLRDKESQKEEPQTFGKIKDGLEMIATATTILRENPAIVYGGAYLLALSKNLISS